LGIPQLNTAVLLSMNVEHIIVFVIKVKLEFYMYSLKHSGVSSKSGDM
jgi:hypothetical protein